MFESVECLIEWKVNVKNQKKKYFLNVMDKVNCESDLS